MCFCSGRNLFAWLRWVASWDATKAAAATRGVRMAEEKAALPLNLLQKPLASVPWLSCLLLQPKLPISILDHFISTANFQLSAAV